MTTLQTILANLQSLGFGNTSNAAIFNEVSVAVAPVIDNTVTELNNGEANILSIITNKNYGKPGYYTSTALAFQYGYSLSTNPTTGQLYYAVIDTSAQIVKQAAFENTAGGLFLKIAKLNSITNLLEPLSSGEYSAFSAYFINFELPGLPITIINQSANILSFNAICSYNTQYDLPTLQTNVSNALNAFRDSYAFDGVLYTTDIESYITANVPGVRSFYVSNQTIDSSPFTNDVALTSGYFNYVSSILSQITYTPI